MADDTDKTMQQLVQHMREVALLESTQSLLEWDERTYMPPGGGAYRAEQVTYLSGLIHNRRTEARVGEWLAQLGDSPLAADPHSDSGATIRELKRQYDKNVKLPQRLVEELSRLSVLGQQAWVEARKNDDFATLQPTLEQLVVLKREQAEAVGYDNVAYDALLDDFEPGEKTVTVAAVLEQLRAALVPLVAAIADAPRRPRLELLERHYPTDAQRQFGQEVAAAIGFDFERGRLDVTHHPFCSGMGPGDCRITTRYDERWFPMALFGTLHEAGHGIYDQGLRSDQYGLPPGSAVSLGIHESQSRMWENAVGRSRAFWEYFYPRAQQQFAALQDVALDDFVFAVNDVRPSLIRVEADEATYNLHIIVRFELEQALISGDLPVADLPGAWREKYRKYLGIEPPDDADGVLQDVHWSAALVGYFPTYALGNLYAAQLFEQADQDLGGLDEQFARGEFDPLRQWLREKIHHRGQCYTASELVQKVTGRALDYRPLIQQLRGKLEPLYGLN